MASTSKSTSATINHAVPSQGTAMTQAPVAESANPTKGAHASAPIKGAGTSHKLADFDINAFDAVQKSHASLHDSDKRSVKVKRKEVDEAEVKHSGEDQAAAASGDAAGDASFAGEPMQLAQAETGAAAGGAAGGSAAGGAAATEAGAAAGATGAAGAGAVAAGAQLSVAGLIAAGAAVVGVAAASNNGNSEPADTTAPSAANSAPTAAAGPAINATEATAGVTVVATLAGTGAVAGDTIELKLGGASFGTPLKHVLTSADITTGSYSFTVAAGSLGADGSKSLTSVVTDAAGNVGAASPALTLALDTVAPSAANSAPTAAAGPAINATEASAGVTVVATLAGTGAVAGDTIELKLGGASFGTPLKHVLTSADITTGSYSFTVAAGSLGADGSKSLTSIVTDAAGNVGTASSALTLTLDTAGPTIQSVTTQGTQVVLTYNETLDAAHAPAAGAFAVTVGGVANAVTGVAVAGNTVTLTLTTAVVSGSAVVVGYTDPTTGNDVAAIQDAAGNDALSFSTGIVSDGYVRGAQIYIDADHDGIADAAEKLTGVVTDDHGQFILPANTTSGAILAVGGVNVDTGMANTLVLKAPAGSNLVSPLTTLVQAVIENHPGTSVADANDAVVTALGLPADTDLTTYDPVATLAANAGDANALVVQKAAVQVATLIALAADAPATGLSSTAAADAVIDNLVSQIGNPTAPATVDLTSSTVVNTVLGTASTADENAIVAHTTAIAGASTLDGIATAQASALDHTAVSAPAVVLTAASDTGSSSTDHITRDTTPTVRVSFEHAATDGTAAIVGDTVTVLNGTTSVGTAVLTTTDIANGYVDITLSALSTDGSKTLTATVTDIANNISAASTALSVTLDTAAAAPTVALTTDSGSSTSDHITKVGTLNVSGTETGATVEYSTNGTTWSSTFTAAEGANAVQVRQIDAAGNTSSASSISFTLDTTAAAPTVALTTDSGSSTSDRITNVGTLNVSGTETGATVEYSTNGGTTWSSTFTAAQGDNTVQVRQTDVAGNTGTATLNFTLDTAAPTLSSSAPTDGQNNVVGNSITLTFNEAVKAGTGNFVLGHGSTSVNISVTDTSQVAISGSTVTITPTTGFTPNTAYTLTMGSGVLTDVAGNTYAGNTSAPLDFTMANNPSVTITTDDNALNIGDSAALTFTLSEASTNFAATDITVSGGTLSNFSGSGSTYHATFTPDTNSTTSASVSVAAHAFTNAAGLDNLAATPLSMTVDTVAPTLSSSTPADNATAVAPGGNIVLTFSENVAAGSGNIVISDGANDTRTIAVGDTSQVTISGHTVTINPTTDLHPSTTYHVTMTSGVVVDTAGNAYAGISSNTTLNFTTPDAPTITSNIDGVTNLDVTSNIVLTASEAVTVGTGYIRIVNDGGTGFHGEVTDNTQMISVADSAHVSIVNNTIIINPTYDLDFTNNYHIEIDAGAFVSVGGVGNVAVTDPAAMDFSTVTPSSGLLGVTSAAASQSMDASGNLTQSFSWIDIEGVGSPSAANGTSLNLSGGNIAMVFKDYDTTTTAGGASDGIGAPDLYVAATGFGAGDMLYVDNQKNSLPNDLGITTFLGDTPVNGTTQISFGTGTAGLGGVVEVTTTPAATSSFTTVLELQTLLQTTYQPIVTG